MSALSPGLLLVGHGSHLSSRSARPVHQLARRLGEGGGFAEVRCAFWKEEPRLRHALDLMESREVFVVPVFTSEGYFTDSVVPRELGIEGALTVRSGRWVRYCMPVGAHRHMHRVILERARETAPLNPEGEGRAALVVVGHGTELHPESAGTTHAVVARLQDEGPYRRVLAAFLDQEPRVEDVLRELDAPDIVLVPFFISEGWHAGTTIPRDLALTGGRTLKGASTIWYAKPAGTHPSMAQVVMNIVQEAAAELADVRAVEATTRPAEPARDIADPARDTAEPDRGPPELPILEAKADFLEWIRGGSPDPRIVLQVAVVPLPAIGGAEDGAGEGSSGQGTGAEDPEDRDVSGQGAESWHVGAPRAARQFEVRHAMDLKAPPGALRELLDPEEALDLASVTSAGRHRPLRTAPDLQRGWRFPALDAAAVWEVLGHVYPGALLHRHLARRGALPLTSFQEAAARQTGMYAGAGGLTEAEVETLVGSCCAPERCLRTPTWAHPHPAHPARGGVPCPEPCSLFISAAKKASEGAR